MQPPWKLVVDDLGRIAHAEIEARPLLLFVGPNSTGKTYLASLMWGMVSLASELPVTQGEAYERCVAWIEDRFARREAEPEFEITPEVHADLVQIVNDTLRDRGAKLAEQTFNRPGFRVGKIELRDVPRGTDPPMRWKTGMVAGLSIRSDTVSSDMVADEPHHRAYVPEYLARNRVLGKLAGLRAQVPGENPDLAHTGPVFLPASRTGFMLTYRSLARKLSRNALIKTGGPRLSVPDLTAPAIDFIDLLIGLRPDDSAFADEAAFLECAMGGRLTLRSDIGLPEVLYEHTAGEPPLPMELSSSLVTELAPVVLTLRHLTDYRVLIIEEPEAHLHPHLQRVLAQVIVRLIRKGLFVWITTHSENFCQQINNFMQIGSFPPGKRAEARQKLGYGEQDYLEMDDVGGYGFGVEGDRTIVEELKKAPDGLVMPTFNHEIFALAKEIDYLADLAKEGT